MEIRNDDDVASIMNKFAKVNYLPLTGRITAVAQYLDGNCYRVRLTGFGAGGKSANNWFDASSVTMIETPIDAKDIPFEYVKPLAVASVGKAYISAFSGFRGLVVIRTTYNTGCSHVVLSRVEDIDTTEVDSNEQMLEEIMQETKAIREAMQKEENAACENPDCKCKTNVKPKSTPAGGPDDSPAPSSHDR